MPTEPPNRPHRRFNPLLLEWVLVSPHRAARPWQGQSEPSAPAGIPAYDPECYLCPGNPRAHGVCNPQYSGVLVFDNDFPALVPDSSPRLPAATDLLVWQPEHGVCRVICFSPRHDLSLAHLPLPAVTAIVDVWTTQFEELGSRPDVAAITIFENRGAIMGASSPHPHGQIWATSRLPSLIAREQHALASHLRAHRTCLLCDYLKRELDHSERIVCENRSFVALVPFWANWPFELLLLSRVHHAGLSELCSGERIDLADLLRRIFLRYDNLFAAPFPNSWGFHLPPTDGVHHPECHLHAHFFPPLLRSSTVRKFMVGYELLAMPQRDLTPEDAAARLRGCREEQYQPPPPV